MNKLLTVREIHTQKKVYWIKSYKALLRYVSTDYIDIFKPIIKGSKSGKRYFIKEENLNIFLKKFENNELN